MLSASHAPISPRPGGWIRAVAIEDAWLNSHRVRPVDLSLPNMNHSFEPEESHFIAFLVKLKGCGVAWTRAVALVEA